MFPFPHHTPAAALFSWLTGQAYKLLRTGPCRQEFLCSAVSEGLLRLTYSAVVSKSRATWTVANNVEVWMAGLHNPRNDDPAYQNDNHLVKTCPTNVPSKWGLSVRMERGYQGNYWADRTVHALHSGDQNGMGHGSVAYHY